MIDLLVRFFGGIFVFAICYMFFVLFFGFIVGFIHWDFSIIANNIFPWFKEDISVPLRLTSLIFSIMCMFGFWTQEDL